MWFDYDSGWKHNFWTKKLLKMSQKQFENFILIIILSAGFGFRFYDFLNIPFTHDELSALSRLKFDSFGELIEKGVKIDGHPAGVQVFLFYWTKLVGTSEILVKIPFLIAGMLSIFLVFKIGKLWFKLHIGLLSAAFIACLQYFIFYSQIARPYVSGLFFTLALVYFWTKYLFKKPNQKGFLNFDIVNISLYVLFGTLAAYNHHFSLLFLMMVGISGLFFLEKENRNKYIFANGLILILYLPHLPITFYQLFELKGIGGWLSPPEYDFIWNYIKYIFNFVHFPIWFIISMLYLVILGIKRNEFKIDIQNPFRYLALIWFLLPLLIGFIYSIVVSPVLQFSVLIFSSPYLLILICSFISTNKYDEIAMLVGTILFIGFITLKDREHYKIAYNQPYETMFETAQKLANKNTSLVLNAKPYLFDYYEEKHDFDLIYTNFSNFNNPIEFKKFLQKQTTDSIYLGKMPRKFYLIAKQFYPKLSKEEKGFTYENYILTKIFKKEEIWPTPKCDFESPTSNFNYKNVKIKGIFLNHFYEMDSTMEFGLSYKCKLDEKLKYIFERHYFVDVILKVKTFDKNVNGNLVLEIFENEKSIHWQAENIKNHIERVGEWDFITLSCRLTNHIKNQQDLENYSVKIYFWNMDLKQIQLDDFEVQFNDGNPYIYGLTQDIK